MIVSLTVSIYSGYSNRNWRVGGIDMPYYFTKGRAYNINYSDLKTELLKLLRGTVFNSYIYCDIYIDKWLVWLKTSDDMTFEQMDTNQEYYAKVINKFRIFNQNIELGNQMMKIHFNSELFAEAIKNKKNVSNVISYKQFEGSQPYYTWSPPDDGEKSISKGPILVVPFKGAGGAYLVIDGNHRVFEAIEKKKILKLFTLIYPTRGSDKRYLLQYLMKFFTISILKWRVCQFIKKLILKSVMYYC